MAQKGIEAGLMAEELFTPVILVVLATTRITPLLLKLVMRENTRAAFSKADSGQSIS